MGGGQGRETLVTWIKIHFVFNRVERDKSQPNVTGQYKFTSGTTGAQKAAACHILILSIMHVKLNSITTLLGIALAMTCLLLAPNFDFNATSVDQSPNTHTHTEHAATV